MIKIKKEIFTIGHSTRSEEELVRLLKHFEITHLIDVRTIPKSRHTPQFNKDHLKEVLHENEIHYTHFSDLGGLRHTTQSSKNLGWHNLAFRGFADYMQTKEFKSALKKLIALAKAETCCLMCAEAVPWRCHRSLISDALVLKIWLVKDIFSLTTAKSHKLTPWIHVEKGIISYPKAIEESK